MPSKPTHFPTTTTKLCRTSPSTNEMCSTSFLFHQSILRRLSFSSRPTAYIFAPEPQIWWQNLPAPAHTIRPGRDISCSRPNFVSRPNFLDQILNGAAYPLFSYLEVCWNCYKANGRTSNRQQLNIDNTERTHINMSSARNAIPTTALCIWSSKTPILSVS